LIESLSGKPQASTPDVAYACGSPLNEKTQDATKSTTRKRCEADAENSISCMDEALLLLPVSLIDWPRRDNGRA
jgi:hypothetical protein